MHLQALIFFLTKLVKITKTSIYEISTMLLTNMDFSFVHLLILILLILKLKRVLGKFE